MNILNPIVVLSMISLVMAGCGSGGGSSDDDDVLSIDFSAAPQYILMNGSSQLTWDAEGASSCTISGVYEEEAMGGKGLENIVLSDDPLPPGIEIPGIPGSELAILASSGSREVLPLESTTYTITCIDGEEVTFTAEVDVVISADADEDGYPDALESIVGTRSDDADSDDDGILDGDEDVNRNGIVDGNETDPLNPASRNPYYCDYVRYDNEGNGLDVTSNCINPEIFSAGSAHTCLVESDGLMHCWGDNQFRQLGVSGENVGDDETAAEGSISISNILQVSAGGATTCAVRRSGSVLCWGRGSYGVTGQGHTNMNTIATAGVNLPEPAIQVSTSGTHTCAVMESGSLYCWGQNSFGQLGHENSEDIGDSEYPDSVGPVNMGDEVKQVSTGYSFTCVLTTGGNVKCWGNDGSGQIGWDADYATYEAYPGDQEGETPNSFPLVSLNGGSTFQISSTGLHSCAMSVGAMTCWGAGGGGQLGYGFTDNVGDDELASDYGAVPYGGGDVTNISTGSSGTCVNLSSGDARCWGSSAHGIGYGNTDSIGDDEPASNGGSLDFDGKDSIYIASGEGHSCALMSDRTVYCWGFNNAGQLGLGHTDSVSSSIDGEVDYR